MQGAAKVGLAVIGFGGLVVGAYSILGQSMFAPKTHTYYAEFADAGGLNPGSRILMAGVNIGQVSEIKLIDAQKARATLVLREDVKLPVGATAVLPSALIGIGDKQVEIKVEKLGTETLEVGATIPGKLTSPIESFLPDSKQTMASLNKTLESFQKLLEDQELKGGLKDLLNTSNQTVAQFGKLAGRMDGLMASSQGQLQSALANGAKIMGDMAVVSRQLATFAKSGKLEKGMDRILAKVDKTLTNGNQLVTDMRGAINDPDLRGNMKAIVGNTKTMTDSGVKIASNVDKMTENGVELSKTANEIAKKASGLADDAKELMQKFKGAADRLGGGSSLGKIDLQADQFRESKSGRWRTEANVVIPLGKDLFTLGLWDAFESNKINAQAIQRRKNIDLRYGVFASKPGVGVDYALTPQFGLRADVFGVNDTRFDLRAKVNLGNGIIGWLGLERIFNRNAPSIGIGYRK